MSVGTMDIWISEVADACGTFDGNGTASVLDCRGVLQWPCGRFRDPAGNWVPVPGGQYRNLPFRCGHLQAEVPPGCYWVIAGWTSPAAGYIHFNYTTHVGITQVTCGQEACVKLFNPSVRLCWNWFLTGLRVLAVQGRADAARIEELTGMVENELLRDAPRLPIERTLERLLEDLTEGPKNGKDEGPRGPKGSEQS